MQRPVDSKTTNLNTKHFQQGGRRGFEAYCVNVFQAHPPFPLSAHCIPLTVWLESSRFLVFLAAGTKGSEVSHSV